MLLKIWLGCIFLIGLTTNNHFLNKKTFHGRLYLVKGTISERNIVKKNNDFSVNPSKKICTDKYHPNTFFRRSFYHLENYHEEESVIELSCVHNRWKRFLESKFLRDTTQKRYFRDIFWWSPKFINSTIFIDNHTFVGYSCYPELDTCSLISGEVSVIKN